MGDYYGPSDLLADYKGLSVQAAGGVCNVAVNNYCNAHNPPEKGGTQTALQVKDALLQVGGSTAVLTGAGGAQSYVDVFTGKGSVNSISAVMGEFVDYSDKFIAKFASLGKGDVRGRCAGYLSDDKLSWQQTLQLISNEIIGLDCNGFVGNWLKVVAPELKVGPNTRPRDIHAVRKASRTKVEDIEYWDVCVWADFSHIAVIDGPVDLGGATPNSFNICQSAGGGPRMNTYSINPSSPGKFRLSGGLPAKDVAGEVYIVTHWA